MQTSLILTSEQRQQLAQHLLPADGCEAVAVVLCGMAQTNGCRRLIAREIHLVPHDVCTVRQPDRVTWPTEVMLPWLAVAEKRNHAVLKIHGHWGFNRFSETDDHADQQLFPSIYSWVGGIAVHGSAVLLNDGSLFGRIVNERGGFEPFDTVHVVGDDIEIFRYEALEREVPGHARRIAQTFGSKTFETLRRLKVGVVGVSGTGSPVVEQLARNCVGTLVLVDPDHIEHKNLNRIVNSTWADADAATLKVDVAKRAITAMGLGTEVTTFATTLFDRDVVKELSTCDLLIGCMDTIDGRHLLNKLATFYSIPYFDLGVKIVADGEGGVSQVVGTVHYLRPGGSSLLSRKVYGLEHVRAAGLKRTDPENYAQLLEEGYIRGIQEDRPAVVQLNTLLASLAVNEVLARLHPYRLDANGFYNVTRVSLSHGFLTYEHDGEPCTVLARHVGRGDVEPLLDNPELSIKTK
ncbi:MAG: ThiF family adenylyltransferase [Burkholderiales bacterium]|nr:MAG: ThiF family adenylyltransferase [Burkholderiales bacterium]